ncbi:MAG: hypothetical protein JO257_07730 [Deltaproteobacteria bacterium]|nr:hypothetical protein [Deltaproteobacteria bacterium]
MARGIVIACSARGASRDRSRNLPAALGASARAEAILALTTLGFAKSEARGAVDDALDDDPPTLEELVRRALRRCSVR